MNELQPGLFDRPTTAGPDSDIAWLEGLLRGSKCWMTAKDIALTVGGRLRDRDIRELASNSLNVISGQRGYKHIEHATAAEVDHAANWLISQGKKMIRRGIGIRSSAHKIFG